MDIVLNLGYSAILLTVMLLSSFIILLNKLSAIRESYKRSLLTFCGTPLILVIVLITIYFKDVRKDNSDIIMRMLCFSVINLIASILLFVSFKRSIINKSGYTDL
ncbi:hypothetical protein [uncultured Mucilaginibacter sp.]|uniref:hypothetical protein n=1 Tax=uncultured Mucilaginibacter sp. TaxID=797541 RepID=UPI0025FECC21|nr:hypothetical protein [uncultured Mucilaginibacter sp.]